jgi:uncharacterized protein YeaO (DUF488 family)
MVRDGLSHCQAKPAQEKSQSKTDEHESPGGQCQAETGVWACGPRGGIRILIDRLWPRGISKEEVALDQWMKDIAPGAKLRKWFGHDPARWDEFRRRYAEEVHQNASLFDQLRSLARRGPITLVYSARDELHTMPLCWENCFWSVSGATSNFVEQKISILLRPICLDCPCRV